MSFITSITSKIFGSNKSVEKIVDGAVNGLDKLNFSNQERAEFNKATADSLAKFVESGLNESSVRSTTRRTIAIAWIMVYLLLIITSVILSFTSVNFVFLSTILTDSTFSLGVVSIIFFFFGSYAANGIIQNIKKKEK